jgi:hypothetical protein
MFGHALRFTVRYAARATESGHQLSSLLRG